MMELYIDKGLRIALKNAESGARLGGEGGDGLKEVVDGHLTVELGFEIDEVGIAYHIVVAKAERAVACFVLGEEEGVFVFVGDFLEFGKDVGGVVGEVVMEAFYLLEDGLLCYGEGGGVVVVEFAVYDKEAWAEVARDVSVEFGE